MTLIEVLAATLLVAVIAIGTFAGFDSAGRASADQRTHAQATQLAQEDEERVRGLTATKLAELAKAGSEAKTWPASGTTFTITSSAKYVSAAKNTFSCETAGATADYLQTTSSVTWPALGSRAPVTQSSIVTNAASGLLVKVFNQNSAPVSGALVKLSGEATGEQTTPASGCVTFLGLSAKEVTVAVTKGTWVDKAGKNPPATKLVKLSTTSIITEEFTIAEPGSIEAEFGTNGAYGAAVTGDTFFAFQSNIKPPPEAFQGGTASTFEHKGPSTVLKGLFPFAKVVGHEPEPYTVWAGDCEKNKPDYVTSGLVRVGEANEAKVTPGATAPVKVEVPELRVEVYEGTLASKLSKLKESNSAKFINKECSGEKAQNASPVVFEHKVKVKEGALVEKYLPYAKTLELCVAGKLASGKYAKNTFTTAVYPLLTNTAKAGTSVGLLYLKGSGFKESASALEC
jgi:Tfp pilus assembly protein PilV